MSRPAGSVVEVRGERMISVGIDIGSTTSKALVLDSAKIRAVVIRPSGALPAQTGEEVFRAALAEAGLAETDVEVVATTGYGRRLVDLGDVVMTEIKACAAGVRFLETHRQDDALGDASVPIRTVIDVGGQDTKVIGLTDTGDVADFSMNDKCAAGTGRFLEMLADKLGLSYETFAAEALKSTKPLQMSSTCAVFAESEVIGLLARGEERADIAAAAHHAIASRIASMVRRTGGQPAYGFAGGGAHNAALVEAVGEALNAPVRVLARPQAVVALGAAAVAAERLRKRTDGR